MLNNLSMGSGLLMAEAVAMGLAPDWQNKAHEIVSKPSTSLDKKLL